MAASKSAVDIQTPSSDLAERLQQLAIGSSITIDGRVINFNAQRIPGVHPLSGPTHKLVQDSELKGYIKIERTGNDVYTFSEGTSIVQVREDNWYLNSDSNGEGALSERGQEGETRIYEKAA